MTPDPPASAAPSPRPGRRAGSRSGRSPNRPPNPGHADWDTLCLLLPTGRVLDLYEAGGRVTRAVLPATPDRPAAAPVARAVALSLVSHGWLARAGRRTVAGERVTSYRLSLRGWYAVRRLRPDLTFARPAGGPATDIPVAPAGG